MVKKVSIVINTYNRALYLDRALSSLYYLDYEDFEVVVVNGPSTDNTLEVIKKYEKDIKVGYCPEANLSMSRNIGIAMASGEYVAFMDDDAIPEPNWLNVLLTGFTDESICAVGSDVYNPTGKAFQCRELITNRFGCDVKERPIPIPYSFVFERIAGGNSIYKKDLLLKVGGFNEQYDYYLDETELCARILDCGYLVKYIPNAFIHHKFAPSYYRDKRRVVLDWSKIVKNTVYFIKSYEHVCGQKIVQEQIELVRFQRQQDSSEAYKSGAITKTEYQTCLKTIEEGISQGLKDYARGYDLFITDECLKKHQSTYKKFPAYILKLKEKKLNIVYFVNDYPPRLEGGIGRFVHALAKSVAFHGHQVHVITQSPYHTDTVDFENGVWVHRITMKHYPSHMLLDLPFNSKYVSVPRLEKLYSYYEELIKIHNKYAVDIVQTPIWDCLGYYALLDKRFTNIVSLHTTMMSVWKDINPKPEEVLFYLDLEKDMLKRADYLLSNSKAIEQTINSYYDNVCEGKTHLVPHGLPDISDKIVCDKKTDKIEILFLGRLEHRKGIDILLQSIPELCDKYPNLIFRFIGNDQILIPNRDITYKENFLSNPENKKYQSQMIFEGVVDEKRLKEAYASCDIFVSPSRYESFGLIFLEAMMFSKPVIGCNVGGMPEVIIDGVTGFLSEPESAKSLTNCLMKLIEDEKLRKKMGVAGRKRYEEKFTEHIMSKNMIDFYHQIRPKKINSFDEFVSSNNLKKEYDYCVSLGFNCYTSMILRKNLFQVYSYPFDWSRGIDETKAGSLGLLGKINLMCNGFQNWLNQDDFIIINDNSCFENEPHMNVQNKFTGFQYIHDFEKNKSIDESYPLFKDKYLRRKDRLLTALHSGQKGCFVFYAGMKFLNDNEILNCVETFKNSFPNSQVDFLVLQNNPDMRPEDISFNELQKNIFKVSFNNLAFDEQVQGTFNLVSNRLEKVLSSFIKMKKYKKRFLGTKLKSKFCFKKSVKNPTADFDGILTYGPYINLSKGRYKITIKYRLSQDYDCYIDVVKDYAKSALLKKYLSAKDQEISFEISLDENANNLEIRTHCLAKKISLDNCFELDFIEIESI